MKINGYIIINHINMHNIQFVYFNPTIMDYLLDFFFKLVLTTIFPIYTLNSIIIVLNCYVLYQN